VDFSEARNLFGIIFQSPRSDCKSMDCGLILKKPRGLSAKCPKLDFPGIVFLKENPWTESTSPWTAPAQSTVDRRPLPCSGALRSSASGRSGARELRLRGRGEEGQAGELNGVVATAQEDDGEGALRAMRGSVGGVGGFTEGGVGFYWAEARRGRA
jgi:hypothetical protein